MIRESYPSDVSEAEWEFVVPYLSLMREDAPQRGHSLRAVFNGLRYIVRTGMQWRFLPNDLPPWHTIYQQAQCWLTAGVFEAIVRDLRMLLREIDGRVPQPYMTDTRSAKAPRCILPLTRWDNCWPWLSRLPTNRSGPKWRN